MADKATIILSGSGTGGPVVPQLAVMEEIRSMRDDVDFVWVGTDEGPARKLVSTKGIPFYTIAAGKLRRYFSLLNVTDVFKVLIGFFQSIFLLLKLRPKVIVSFGGFVSVPLTWVGGLLRVPVHIHQLDVRPGLANKLMAKVASGITVGFSEAAGVFENDKVKVVGNPIAKEVVEKLDNSKDLRKSAQEFFHLDNGFPTLLVIGGGTG